MTMTVKHLLESLEVIADEEEPDPKLRKRRKKKYRKAYKANRLHFQWVWENRAEAYKLCVAEQINNRYHWLGWEARDNALWAIATQHFPYPRWDGTPCKLLVLAEQGLGDEIIFASCFPDLLSQNPECTIECDPRLLPVFERSFDCTFVTRWTEDGKPRSGAWYRSHKTAGDFDAFVPAGQLPKLYRRKRSDFPGEAYIRPSMQPNTPTQYPAIGLSWEGRQGAIMPTLMMVKEGNYVDLQYKPKFVERQYPPPEGIHEVSFDVTHDIDALFDCVANLNAVVTVPNTVAHVAGSLGVDCHVIRPDPVYAGERPQEPTFHNRLRWDFGLFNGRTPWYRSVRTYPSLAAFRGAKR